MLQFPVDRSHQIDHPLSRYIPGRKDQFFDTVNIDQLRQARHITDDRAFPFVPLLRLEANDPDHTDLFPTPFQQTTDPLTFLRTSNNGYSSSIPKTEAVTAHPS